MPNKEDRPAPAAVREDSLSALPAALLDTLLCDHTTGRNIFWATHDYEALGSDYAYHSPIMPHLVTGDRGMVVRPRVQKNRELQTDRAKDMAEVFTPSWVCNKQNNLIDSAWFGRDNVFNTETDRPDGTHSWTATEGSIAFPEGRTWRSYVSEKRLEITCGEAPYLVSRYDTVTGEPIPVEQRIGLLDRKLRIVGENTSASADWLKAAQTAFMSTYGYEWQGDSLVLARANLLHTFVDYYTAKFGKSPQLKSLQYIAYIISWNIWQMDGLKGVVPDTCGERRKVEHTLFGDEERITVCQGCKNDDLRAHNGIYALVKNWGATKDHQKIRFIDLIK